MIERALHPGKRVACAAVRQLLYSAESDAGAMPARLERHRQACLSCQAEAARQRRIVRALADMASQVEPAPHDLTAALEAGASNDLAEVARPQVGARTAIAASLAALGIAVALRKRAS